MDDLLDNAPCGFLSLADDGTILSVNATLQDLLGYAPNDLPGRPWELILSAGGRIFYQTHLFPLLMLQGSAEEIYLSLRSQSGTDLPVLLSAKRQEAAEVGVTHCVLIPIRQRLRFEEELLQAKKAAEAAIAETAHAHERERLISGQLQEALQPGLPGRVPGLALTRYFEPALQLSEGVGGDFYDVFPLSDSVTALVVGDLSGKGLAAATQVATVRNMLRAFIYTQSSLAEAVTLLNGVLAENELLTGFATLFAGAYHSDSRTLRYVCGGQEPALVRRAGNYNVEELVPTGPVVGALPYSRFTEQSVPLYPGDALAIFTDGITEVGPTRLTMLGLEGATALFAPPLLSEGSQEPEEVAEQLMLRLIAGVDAAAQDSIRDDVCLLVGVVTL